MNDTFHMYTIKKNDVYKDKKEKRVKNDVTLICILGVYMIFIFSFI